MLVLMMIQNKRAAPTCLGKMEQKRMRARSSQRHYLCRVDIKVSFACLVLDVKIMSLLRRRSETNGPATLASKDRIGGASPAGFLDALPLIRPAL
jgi:hypothetical protein